MPLHQILCNRFIQHFTRHGLLMYLRQGIVESLAVSERFMQRRVESVEKSKLERVRTLEQKLQLRE
jgi:hypothetical protein